MLSSSLRTCHPRLVRRPLRISARVHHTLQTTVRLDSENNTTTPPLAFVFDLDGVLLHGKHFIPEGKRTIQILEGDNLLRTKIPYILLTNGGGVSEEKRCQLLTHELGFPASNKYLTEPIQPTQYIQAHTILQSIAPRYSDTPVLVLGGKGDKVRKVAEGYGFKKAYTTLDVLAWNPSVWPLHDITPDERKYVKDVDFSQTPISSIFVFHDPRQWALDIQILCDVLQSGGIIGGSYIRPEERTVELVFCNPDLLWRSDFNRPRLGQGSFIQAFQAIYKSLTGSTYPYIQYGKPTAATFNFAEKVLIDRLETLHGHKRLPPVYMIGDNPDSDIAGANAKGWCSVLVHTGVYDPTRGAPSHRPTHEASDVEEAVRWAIDRELHLTTVDRI